MGNGIPAVARKTLELLLGCLARCFLRLREGLRAAKQREASLGNAWLPEEVPRIPGAIEEAAEFSKLIVFIGAGVARNAGAVSWETFADNAFNQLVDRGVVTPEHISAVNEYDPRTRLSLAKILAGEKNVEIDIRRALGVDRKKATSIYAYLKKLGCTYVTTNYDQFLEEEGMIGSPAREVGAEGEAEAMESHATTAAGSIDVDSISLLRQPGALIHLHGCITAPEDMIVTTSDYLRHYSRDVTKQFLLELFGHYTVLFVGYSLRENEVLEQIFRAGSDSAPSDGKLFWLYPVRSSEQELFTMLEKYYKQTFRVQLIPVARDRLGYGCIENVLRDWSDRLVMGQQLLADDLRLIKEVTGG